MSWRGECHGLDCGAGGDEPIDPPVLPRIKQVRGRACGARAGSGARLSRSLGSRLSMLFLFAVQKLSDGGTSASACALASLFCEFDVIPVRLVAQLSEDPQSGVACVETGAVTRSSSSWEINLGSRHLWRRARAANGHDPTASQIHPPPYAKPVPALNSSNPLDEGARLDAIAFTMGELGNCCSHMITNHHNDTKDATWIQQIILGKPRRRGGWLRQRA